MFEDVMRTADPIKLPAFAFETALDVAAVGEHRSARTSSIFLLQPYPRLIAVEKLDAGLLQCAADFRFRIRATADLAAVRFQPSDGRRGYAGVAGEVVLRPAEQGAGGFDLAD